MTLWNGSVGFGTPVFVAGVPAWHPLGLLAGSIGPGAVGPIAAIFSALILGWLLRSFGARPGWTAVAALAAGAGIALQDPAESILVLGVLGAIAALEFFSRRPSRGRWAIAVAAIG
ncbi:MAG TPA: hypothetical protein VLV48_02430, partial [Thermoanaerobaculia bacterium]|nr:hypothetical protein [Thermoanaerobaculia bacterium]